MACPCQNHSFPGVRGLVAEPVGTITTQGGAVAGGALALGGGALSGALVGGLSGGSWNAAGTGALLAGGVQGAIAGVGLMMLPETRIGGAVIATCGAVALLWGGSRAVVTAGRRRRF